MPNTDYGSILLTTADKVSRTIKKKTGSQNGYKPSEWADEINLMGLLPIRTASGAIAHFEDGADDVPIVEGIFAFNPIQTGTGDPSPTNQRPISGTDELTLNHKGKNLFDPNTEFSTLYVYAVAKNVLPSATCTMSFTDNDTTQDIRGVYFGFISSDYTSGAPTVYRWGIQNGAVVGDVTNLYLSENMTGLFYYPNNPTTLEKVLNRFNVQIELGSTATTYEQYTGHVYPISWTSEGTKYGGTYNSKTGVLRVTHSVVDLGSLTWTYRTDVLSVPCFTSSVISDIKSGSLPIACSCFKIMSPNRNAIDGNHQVSIMNNSNAKFLVIRYDEYTDGTAVKTALIGQKLVYELATPIEIQLEPTEMATLLGVNNFYHDGNGDSTIEYRADIDLLLASLQGNRGLQMTRSAPTEEEEEQTEEVEEN